MCKVLLEFGANPDTGIWPKRDATGPVVIAHERGYAEIVQAITDAREKRGARGNKAPREAMRKLKERAVRVDGAVVEDPQTHFNPGFEGVLQVGKRNFARVRLRAG